MIDKLIDLADRFALVFAAIGAFWFALSCASYANFVRLPDLALLKGIPAIIASILYNAAYWGFLYPRVETRRKERLGQMETSTNG
jgi:hypothetical protein